MKVEEFKQRPLRAHNFLADVPLCTLERTELSGGRDGMTIEEVSAIVGFGSEVGFEVGPVTKALFWFRTLIGRILHWDKAPEPVETVSFLSRLSEEDRTRSLVVPGKVAGISRLMYQFENEMLGEIIYRSRSISVARSEEVPWETMSILPNIAAMLQPHTLPAAAPPRLKKGHCAPPQGLPPQMKFRPCLSS